MTDEMVLYGFLVASVLLGVLVILMAMMAIERKLGDLEYQIAEGASERPRIQSWVNLRSKIDRALFGLIFVGISTLLLAGAPEVLRMWSNRVSWTIFLAIVLAFEILDWSAERKMARLVMEARKAQRERQAAEDRAAEQERNAVLQSDRDSYRQMADEAVARLEDAVRQAAAGASAAPVPALAAVVPEHSSPVTPEQQADADRQTMRARLTASTLALGLPPREAGEAEPEAPHERESVDVASIQEPAIQAIADAINANADKDADR